MPTGEAQGSHLMHLFNNMVWLEKIFPFSRQSIQSSNTNHTKGFLLILRWILISCVLGCEPCGLDSYYYIWEYPIWRYYVIGSISLFGESKNQNLPNCYGKHTNNVSIISKHDLTASESIYDV